MTVIVKRNGRWNGVDYTAEQSVTNSSLETNMVNAGFARWAPGSGPANQSASTSSGTVGYRKRALANLIHRARNQRVSLTNHEIMVAPSAWTSRRYFKNEEVKGTATGSAGGADNTGWYYVYIGYSPNALDPRDPSASDPVSTVEPDRTVGKVPGSLILMSDGHLWAAYEAAKYPITTKASLMGTNGKPVVPTVSLAYDYNAAPVDAPNVMFKQSSMVNYGGGALIDATTGRPKYLLEREKYLRLTYVPAALKWANDYSADVGFDRKYVTDATGNAVTAAVAPSFTTYAFKSKGSVVAIQCAAVGNSTVVGDTMPVINVLIDGVFARLSALPGPAADGTSKGPRYQWNFPTDVVRERTFIVTSNVRSDILQAIFTSNGGDIQQPDLAVSILTFGDSTHIGAAPGPYTARCANYGSAFGWSLGFGPGIQMGEGGTGFIYQPLNPNAVPNYGTQVPYPFIERCNRVADQLDVSKGAAKQALVLVDISGWDADATGESYKVTSKSGFSATFNITSADRQTQFTSWLSKMSALQPRNNVSLSKPGANLQKDANGNYVVDMTATEINNEKLRAVVADWMVAIQNTLVDDQYMVISLSAFDDAVNVNNFDKWYGVNIQDGVHVTSHYHALIGEYVASQVIQGLIF